MKTKHLLVLIFLILFSTLIQARTWSLDFNTNPTEQNWKLRDDSSFNTSELVNGVWKAKPWETLDTTPKSNFDTKTNISLEFKNTSIGGKGAVFWINADSSNEKTATIYASLYASLRLQENGTQTLGIYNYDGSQNLEFKSYTNLSSDFISLKLEIEPSSNLLKVTVNNQETDTFSYVKHISKNDDRFATILAWRSTAEFKSINIESNDQSNDNSSIERRMDSWLKRNALSSYHLVENSDNTRAVCTASSIHPDGNGHVYILDISGSNDIKTLGQPIYLGRYDKLHKVKIDGHNHIIIVTNSQFIIYDYHSGDILSSIDLDGGISVGKEVLTIKDNYALVVENTHYEKDITNLIKIDFTNRKDAIKTNIFSGEGEYSFTLVNNKVIVKKVIKEIDLSLEN